MAEPNSKNAKVLEVEMDSSVSAEDLEAQIAEAASSIGSAKTVAGKTIKKTTTKPKPSKTTKKKATKKTATKTKKITKTKKLEIQSSSVSAEKLNESDKTVVLSRHGKDLTPIGDVKKLKKAQASVIPKPKTPKPDEFAVKVRVEKKKPVHTAKPYPVIKDSPKVSAKPAETVKEVEPQLAEQATKVELDPRPRAAKRTPHVARIYDSEVYHMPISVDHHHRRAMVPLWGQVLILLAGIIGMIIFAITSG